MGRGRREGVLCGEGVSAFLFSLPASFDASAAQLATLQLTHRAYARPTEPTTKTEKKEGKGREGKW